MPTAVAAAVLYFALVFGAGFVLGVVRVGVLVPRLGETAAVAMELPVMLALSWIAARTVVRWLDVPATIPARLVMGGGAFALLMGAELVLATVLLGLSLSQHVASYVSLPKMLGLMAQLVFAAMPVLLLGRQGGHEGKDTKRL